MITIKLLSLVEFQDYISHFLALISKQGVVMVNKILERYKQTDSGSYVIGINAGKSSDLYNDFDKHMPYVRKELDQDLVEYISDSARDLYKEDFIIEFQLLEQPGEDLKQRIIKSVNSYFIYLKLLEIKDLSRLMRTSLIFLVIGITLLFFSVLAHDESAAKAPVIFRVFAEGLTVASWVSLWQALATFLVNWTPYTRNIKLYERIANAPVNFL